MSVEHPIITVTGSSGAGTTSVTKIFQEIFRREGIRAAFVEGDAFHRFDRETMRRVMAARAAEGRTTFSHFGIDANRLEDLEATFRSYGRDGSGWTRNYVHDPEEARLHARPVGTFTDWRPLEPETDLLFYEGLHGAVVTETVDLAGLADLRIGIVPIVNLEWIQKLHRDRATCGRSVEAVADTILRRMPDYVDVITPQFTRTDINFQRIPTVDTSNPFAARQIPSADESLVIIRFRNPSGIDFVYLRKMIGGSFLSRANSIVVPGGKFDLAMQLILTPSILRLVERRRAALRNRIGDPSVPPAAASPDRAGTAMSPGRGR